MFYDVFARSTLDLERQILVAAQYTVARPYFLVKNTRDFAHGDGHVIFEITSMAPCCLELN
jgi:hypothetical protein